MSSWKFCFTVLFTGFSLFRILSFYSFFIINMIQWTENLCINKMNIILFFYMAITYIYCIFSLISYMSKRSLNIFFYLEHRPNVNDTTMQYVYTVLPFKRSCSLSTSLVFHSYPVLTVLPQYWNEYLIVPFVEKHVSMCMIILLRCSNDINDYEYEQPE